MNHKLLQLLADNRRPDGKARSRIEAAADETVVYLYDPIVGSRALAEIFGYVCAQDLVPQIDAIKTPRITIRMNCPGGDVFAMQAIVAALRNQKAEITGHVDGLAASAATVIASACDRVVMEPGSLFMIHNSQCVCMGDKSDMLEMAALQEKVDGTMADNYVERTGKDREQVVAWMDAETWFTAEEAVSNGFADEVVTTGKRAKAAADWNLSAFANAPKVEAAPEPSYITDEHRERQQQRLRLAARLTSSR